MTKDKNIIREKYTKNKHTKDKNENTKLKWTPEQEYLLIGWAEKSSGYAWMHSKCVHYYKKRNRYISIPAAIFGYLAGATTLLSNDLFNNLYIRGAVGFSAILGGIFSNFQQMFTYKELTEQHRLSTLRFLAFFRDISCELSMHPDHRTNPIDYINMKRLELDKMLEQSPNIPDTIVTIYNIKSRNTNLHKPEVANILQTITPYGQYAIKNYNTKYKKKLSKDEKKNLQLYFKKWKKHYYIKTGKKINNLNYLNNNDNKGMKDNDILQVEVANSISRIDSNNISDNEEDLHRARMAVFGYDDDNNNNNNNNNNNDDNNEYDTSNTNTNTTSSSEDNKHPIFLSTNNILNPKNIKLNVSPFANNE
jgi:hypothetical protein